jgi:hypothetical protein
MFQEYYYQVSHFYIVVYDRFCLVHGSRKRLSLFRKCLVVSLQAGL